MCHENTNATNFCNIFFRHRAVFPSCNKKTVLSVKNTSHRESSRIIYRTFSNYSRPLHMLEYAGNRLQTTDRILELPTDRYFIDLPETCLYMVDFGLKLVFS